LLKNRQGRYDPGQLPHINQQARSVDPGSGSSADRTPFPGERGRSNDVAPTLASAFNESRALLVGVNSLVPGNGNEQHDLHGPSAI
jgi:hypothetical protein